MRILHVLRQLQPGGIECWLERLLAAWRGPRRPQFHFALECEEFGSLAGRFRELGAKLHHCPSPHRPLASARTLRRILLGHGPFDALHCHTHYASPFALGVAAESGVPIRLAHSHADFRRANVTWPRRAYATAARQALRFVANAKVAVSRAASLDLFGPRNHARILPCGIDASRFLQALPQRDPSRFTLVHAGRLVPEKNHEHLLHLTLELRKLDRSVRLWLVGDGPLREFLQSRARQLGLEDRVTFWGSRGDVAEIMASADLFVFPSLSEGLGLAAVEAQAAGLPVLAAAHLPAEIDWLPGAVQRLALDMPMGKWAETVMALRTYPPLPSAVREEWLAQSKFSMQANIEALEQIYAG
jgi:glycosyltransferase involved in cell wall biosynthesis